MSIIDIDGRIFPNAAPVKPAASGAFANQGMPLSELPADERLKLMQALGNPPLRFADVSGRTAEVDPFSVQFTL